MENLPKPLLFNPLKHHLGYIKQYISQYNREDISKLKSDLLKIGDSQMDLYIGALSIAEISRNIIFFINTTLLTNKDSYLKYIHEVNNYHKITISDGSVWILRAGLDSERYIHFHPARYSPNTIRIKANTLKILIAVHIMYPNHVGLPEINYVRAQIFGLAPLKQLYPNLGIVKLMELL